MKKKSSKSLGFYFFIIYITTFFISSAILMVSWNYTVPRIIHSYNKNYNIKTDFTPIDYPTSIVFMILFNVIFSSINCCLLS